MSLTVSATREPSNSAPRNLESAGAMGLAGVGTSQQVATRAACFNVRDREETDVENEFATSLAPILKASMKAKMMPSAKI